LKQLEYKEHIDALRGIAVLLVVSFHTFDEIMPGGFIGVDVFFVISGYLITTIILASIENDELSLKEFYSKRIRRLFPALLTVLIFSLLVGWLILTPDELKQLGKHVSKSSVFWLNFRLISEAGYFDVESHYKPLLHLWTLSVEEQYYLVWPLVLLVIIKMNVSPSRLFATVIIVSMAANLFFVNGYAIETYFHTATRFWQLACGSLLASYWFNRCMGSSNVLFFIGLLIIAFGAILIDQGMAYPGYWGILPVLGAVLVIYSNVKLKTYFGLSKIGLISYPLYLWHWVLISFLYIYIGREPNKVMLFGVTMVAFLLAYLTYRYIERYREKKVTTLLLLCMVFTGLAGAYVSGHEGLPERGHLTHYMGSSIQFTRTPAKDESCLSYSEQSLYEKLKFDYCRASALDRTKLVAIIGDSHAHVLYPGIKKVAAEEGYGVIMLANSSCPPLIGFVWGRNEKEVALCKYKIKQIMQVLENDTRIEKVILATRGPVYINGEVKGVFTGKTVDDSLRAINAKYVHKLTYKLYFSSLSNTFRILEKLGHVKESYYMLENPELDFLPKEVIPRPFDYFGVSANRKTMEKDLYLKRMSVYRLGVKKLRVDKLSVLDPLEAMCDKKLCYSFKEGGSLYADDDHFSVLGSEYIANYFKHDIFEGKEN